MGGGENKIEEVGKMISPGWECLTLSYLIWYLVMDLSRAASGVVMVICCSVEYSDIAETFIA